MLIPAFREDSDVESLGLISGWISSCRSAEYWVSILKKNGFVSGANFTDSFGFLMRKTAQSGRLSSAGAIKCGMTNKCSDNSAGDLILQESIPPKIIELSGVWGKSNDFETEQVLGVLLLRGNSMLDQLPQVAFAVFRNDAEGNLRSPVDGGGDIF